MKENNSGFKFIDHIHPEVLLKEALINIKKGFSFHKTVCHLAKRFGTTDTDMFNRLKLFKPEIDKAIDNQKQLQESQIPRKFAINKMKNLESVISYLEENKASLVSSEDKRLQRLQQEEEQLKLKVKEIEDFLMKSGPISVVQHEVEELRVTYNTLQRLGLLSGQEDDSEVV